MSIYGKATEDCISRATVGYVAAALWLSTDDAGDPLDARYDADSIAPESLEQMGEDIAGFLAACWGDTWEDFSIDLSGIEPEQIGHDFWLTRNHHGAGFWDRGLGEIGDALTKLAHSYGDSDLYVGDDGQVYVS